MDPRAPRYKQIEIPLTVTNEAGEHIQCACVNISESGALLHVTQDHQLQKGQRLTARLVKGGHLADVTMRVERLDGDGVGVRFLRDD
ncbi:PilZ domain-containing protein [Reinekea blandensis]|uniref:PilZ domain-containing protein n=1 Tax=Reinekea blandensis MED297 TaxID=314283 RepID=A4BB15_9GAMM|nr:PilZ domain-containing protein [Reinekea blandensis]EAR10628.1 hypothetical protein MED297_11450 [Reinekea sp. MED297] [Reinekea blandensis MED297]